VASMSTAKARPKPTTSYARSSSNAHRARHRTRSPRAGRDAQQEDAGEYRLGEAAGLRAQAIAWSPARDVGHPGGTGSRKGWVTKVRQLVLVAVLTAVVACLLTVLVLSLLSP
jgi:hypothetical protein